ncbi:MAG: RIP metalloprotease RseP [Candidatus Kerfeldbacteria bacterium CG_4_10_14_0_8_um_filter_42_10]|uniref:Zinc metalloprotease n=1 Tax=Candidatus Kerfeldbacteria bacterium CG_4_10_14_0_8_um_filter_42_10 TaxID=2014248 RepID=A0A2M7RFN3_9BACT|nr:MAG: RIP metalloprotease RseP [Candidatus Kerfeldbacteria bacterium CG_4_10_14_0_8_um_filter_42_10]
MISAIITLAIVLGLVIFVHELGHFVSAKRLGVKVDEFGFGFPPRLFGFQRFSGQKLEKLAEKEKIEPTLSDDIANGTEVIKETISDKIQGKDQVRIMKKWHFFLGNRSPRESENLKGGTVYSINWLPLGGFVKIKGEQGDKKEEKDSFTHKKIWQRSLILSSGVLMNVVLAAVLLSIGFYIGLPSVVSEDIEITKVRELKIQVVSLSSGSPAETAGIKVGDVIRSINDQQFTTAEEVQEYNKERLGQTVQVTIQRGQETMAKEITLSEVDESGVGKMGVGLVQTGLVSYPWYQAIWEGAKAAFYLTWQILAAFYELIKNLIVAQTVPADIAGPIGIAVLTSQVSQMGLIYLLQFTALLSINLAILNFIPFPALDGGRVLFLLVEKIRGKALSQKIESTIHTVGFFILIALIIVVSVKDVSRFKESIFGFFKNIIS